MNIQLDSRGLVHDISRRREGTREGVNMATQGYTQQEAQKKERKKDAERKRPIPRKSEQVVCTPAQDTRARLGPSNRNHPSTKLSSVPAPMASFHFRKHANKPISCTAACTVGDGHADRPYTTAQNASSLENLAAEDRKLKPCYVERMDYGSRSLRSVDKPAPAVAKAERMLPSGAFYFWSTVIPHALAPSSELEQQTTHVGTTGVDIFAHDIYPDKSLPTCCQAILSGGDLLYADMGISS